MANNTRQAPPRRGVIGLIAVIAGTALMWWSFTMGISAALDGSGPGAGTYVFIFIASAVLVLAALGLAIAHLRFGYSKPIAIATIALAAVPIVGAIVVAIRANLGA